MISLFVEIVVACFFSLSTWACNLLGFVVGLLLPGLLIGYFFDLKITLSEALFQCLTLLLMVTIDYIVVNFLAIWEMNLLFELFQCNSWTIISSPSSPPPPIFLIPFNKSCFIEPCVLNLKTCGCLGGLFPSHVLYHQPR